MCSGHYSWQAWRIWGILDKEPLTYKNFVFHGEASKLAALPRPQGMSNQKAFNNFSSPMSEDDSEWIKSQCEKIPKTSLFKYDVCKQRWFGHLIQNGRLPVGFRLWLQETFWCVLSWYTCIPILIVLGQSVWRGWSFLIFQGALWSHFATPTNIDTYTCSGQDPLHGCSIWCWSDNVCRSYREFLLYGEASKLSTLPRPQGMSNQKAFNNFSSSRS